MPLGIHMLRDYEGRTVTRIPKALGAKRTKRGQGLYWTIGSGQNRGLRFLQGEITVTLQLPLSSLF